MEQATLSGERRRSIVKWCAVSGAPLLMVGVYFVMASSRKLANLAVRWFSRPVRDGLGTLFGLLPFSMMEVIYTAAGIFLIVFLIRTVVLTVRGERRLLILLKRLLALVIAVLYILAGYLWLFGIDYQADSFADKEGFVAPAVAVEDLYSAAKLFILRCIYLADKVERDENGLFAEDMDAYFDRVSTVYDNLEERFPSLKAVSRRPKAMFYSKFMSIIGFTGVYFAFTGESNINVDVSPAFIPSTVAHELAHQRGIYSEQECNFLGVTACVTSDDVVYQYSGYLAGSLYLMNALYRADPDLWSELRAQITGGMDTDWRHNSEYWRQFQSKVSETTEKVYDTYLKVNGQELGFQSYGACVDYLVAYYLAGGYNGLLK